MRIYLAGPDVFVRNAKALGDAKKAMCVEFGFEGHFPMDPDLHLAGLPAAEIANRIYKSDEAMMDLCDATIIHMTPFRGVSMDVGTAFEAGYMRAQRKRILAYTNDPRTWRDRTEEAAGPLSPRPDGTIEAADGLMIEDFDLAENLMVVRAVVESGYEPVIHAASPDDYYTDLTGFRQCLEQLARTKI